MTPQLGGPRADAGEGYSGTVTPTNPRTPTGADTVRTAASAAVSTAASAASSAVHLDLRQDVALLTAPMIDINSVSGNEKVLADAVEQALSMLPQLELVRDGDSIIAR